MNFGLKNNDLIYMNSLFSQYSNIVQVKIFGSRAIGNYKKASDVDLVLYGNKIDFATLAKIHGILEEESPMPFFFDVIDYNSINKVGLKEHIDNYGKIIYTNNGKI